VNQVFALVRNAHRFRGMSEPFFPEGVEVVDVESLHTGLLPMGSIDIVCHLASARPVHTPEDIAGSLSYTRKIIELVIKYNIAGFINASSQSVYGTRRKPLWNEETPTEPETPYAQAKWAGEVMASMIKGINANSAATSLRFAQLIGPSPAIRSHELPHKMLSRLNEGMP